MSQVLKFWECYPSATPTRALLLTDRHARLPQADRKLLIYGNGHNYGDACLNDVSHISFTRTLYHFITFGSASDVLRAEAGVLRSKQRQLKYQEIGPR